MGISTAGEAAGRRRAWLLVALVALAMVLGGGGSPNPASELALQIATALIVIAWAWLGGFQTRPPHEVLAIAALVLAVPIVQLVPLPPALWQSLPGREFERASLDLVGAGDAWMPLSIAPHMTLAGLLALLPPCALMLMVSLEPRGTHRRLLGTIALVALAAVGLGAFQLGSETGFRLYPDAHPRWITGFHANRNAAADAFLIGMLALSGWAMGRKGVHRLLISVALALLALAVVLTASRMGIALLLVAGAGLAAIGGSRVSARQVAFTLSLAAGLIVSAMIAVGMSTRAKAVLSRFTDTVEFRPELWRDSWTTLVAHWPWGSGLGTFVPAFLPHERLAVVDATMPNRAHNDFLEFAIEAGLPGLIVLALIGLLVARLALQRFNEAKRSREFSYFAVVTLILIALHGFVDYPLRNMAIASLTGVAVGMLAPVRPGRGTGSDRGAQAMGSGQA